MGYEEKTKLCDECKEDLRKIVNRKATKLMYLIHELKHMGCSIEEFYAMFEDMFPFFRDVEGYNPEYEAVYYLFDVVLVEKTTDDLR